MNDFTASNGIAIRTKDGDLDFKRSDPFGWLGLCGGDVVDALREFFQAEADERLGRFRHGQFLVYPEDEPGDVMVIHETTPDEPWRFARNSVSFTGEPGAAARAYFDAHPEPKPLPTVEGVYAMRPRVHLYERLIMLRGGQWLHLYTSADEFADGISAEQVARTAVDEGRLTLLTPEVAS